MPGVPFTAVRMRLRGVTLPTAIAVKAEEVAPAIAHAAQLEVQIKKLTTKLWHSGREKGKATAACERALREMQNIVKTESREVKKALVTASQKTELAATQVKRLESDNKYWRRKAYDYTLENTALKEEVECTARRLRELDGANAQTERNARKLAAQSLRATDSCDVRVDRKYRGCERKQRRGREDWRAGWGVG